ncbi:MAG: DNA mismatch repair protein MutS, partial [Psychroflexus sp.]|nr:DNA mismatch repair protein MutS [Psychroflexus sp.]
MKQYNAIKQKHPDALLLFRVGDFYETFGEDAVKTAQILNIVLTNRNNGSERTELAGFPHHSLNTYLPKLVKAGQRVAICDQLEDPKATKKIVKRGVTELVTPGVALNDEVLTSRSNNFLCAIHFAKTNIGIAFLDISTGEFLTSEGSKDYIDKLLQNFSPSEVLVSKSNKNQFKSDFGEDYNCFFQDNWLFKIDYAQETLNSHFKTNSLKGFGIEHLESGIIASGAIMHYLSETRHDKLQHINNISRISEEAYVWMDRFTIRNLELYQGNSQQAVTLIDVIDKTISAMGSRMLKRWLSLPLKQREKIEDRLEAVDYLNKNQNLLKGVQQQLKQISDLERLISKVATQKVNPRELLQLKDSLEAVIPIKTELSQKDNEALKVIADNLHTCELLREKIHKAIQPETPVLLSKGNVIAKGFHEELDELRDLAYSGKDYLDEMLKRESESTGIPKLKIGSNNVFSL